jgi:hypothetical protein
MVRDLEQIVPMYGGIKLELVDRICPLKFPLSISDFEGIGDKHGFKLEYVQYGVNLINGKNKNGITPISTPIYHDKKNSNLFGIIYWEDKKPFFYSARQVRS